MRTRSQLDSGRCKDREVRDLILVFHLPSINIKVENASDLSRQAVRKCVTINAKEAPLPSLIQKVVGPVAVRFREHVGLKCDADDQGCAIGSMPIKSMGERS